MVGNHLPVDVGEVAGPHPGVLHAEVVGEVHRPVYGHQREPGRGVQVELGLAEVHDGVSLGKHLVVDLVLGGDVGPALGVVRDAVHPPSVELHRLVELHLTRLPALQQRHLDTNML